LLPPQAHTAKAANRVTPVLHFFSFINIFLFLFLFLVLQKLFAKFNRLVALRLP
jgi:hypothetical protein